MFLNNSFFINNKIFRFFETKFQQKFTRGIIETIKPYLFRHYFSEKTIRLIKDADVVYAFCEYMTDGLKTYLPMVLFQAYLAKRLGNKVVAICKDLPLNAPLALSLLKYVFNMVDLVTVRDYRSREKLKRLGINPEKVRVCYDFAFACDLEREMDVNNIIQKENIRKGDVGLIIRGDRPVDYTGWQKVIHHIQRKYNKSVFFLHTCKAHDQKVYNRLSKKCSIRDFSEYYDYQTLIQTIPSFDVIVTDRYHGAIFSLLSRTPVVPVWPNGPKTRELFKLFDYPIAVTPIDDSVRVIQNIDYVLENRKKIAGDLEGVRSLLRNKLYQQLEVLYVI